MTIDGDRAAAVFEDLWRQLVQATPARLWRRLDHGVVALVSEIPAPSMNGAFIFRTDADIDGVRTTLKEVARAQVPFCLQARPALRDALTTVADELGMVASEDTPLMVLDDPSALRAASQIDGLGVRLLADDERQAHEALFAQGFEIPSEIAHAFMQVFGDAPGLRAFVGEAEGAQVTTALTVPSADSSVAVFNVATPPEQRGRGFGGAVTATAVLDAFAKGATFAWLQTSAAGLSVYERLGFRVVESWPVWVSGGDE